MLTYTSQSPCWREGGGEGKESEDRGGAHVKMKTPKAQRVNTHPQSVTKFLKVNSSMSITQKETFLVYTFVIFGNPPYYQIKTSLRIYIHVYMYILVHVYIQMYMHVATDLP